MSLWCLHSREEYWDSPGEFKPERFLDGEGDLVPASGSHQPETSAAVRGRRTDVYWRKYGQEQTFSHVDQRFAEF